MKKFRIDKVPAHVYVRWDLDIKDTIKRGYSIDHATGEKEPGISVISLDEYSLEEAWAYYAKHVIAGTPFVVLDGIENGRDSDGMPTLDASTIRVLGEIPSEERDKFKRKERMT